MVVEQIDLPNNQILAKTTTMTAQLVAMIKLLLETKQQVNKHKLHRGSMLKFRWPMRNAWRTQTG